jgi:hypothetical protein
VPLFLVAVTLSCHIAVLEGDSAPTCTVIGLKLIVLIVAVRQGSTYLNVPVVEADHAVGVTSPIDAFTSTVQTAALASTSEAANVSVDPDNVIN